MSFLKTGANTKPVKDTVFVVADRANQATKELGKENVTNATIGALFTEEGNLTTLKSVWDIYENIETPKLAKYASSFKGTIEFREAVQKWLFNDIDMKLYSRVIATPGGSGAISTTYNNCLNVGETVIIPDIAWGPYKLMAKERGLKFTTYSMFEGNEFNITSFKETCKQVMNEQGKIVIVINDPCHNPTGYSLSKDEWTNVIDFLNEIGKQGSVVLLNDIAYIDYSVDLANSRKYMEVFNNISENVAVIIAFSCSKTLTAYGLRIGAQVFLASNEETVKELEAASELSARATWSNIPNGGMELFVQLQEKENMTAYLSEKDTYIELLKKRSSIFIEEAAAVGLKHYPYKEGFFITLIVEDDIKEELHNKLMDNNIYTVQVDKGIRIAVCSLPVASVYGVAEQIQNIKKTL